MVKRTLSRFKTNRNQLVIQSVLGEIADPPINIRTPYRISADGDLQVLPGTGGITYNVRIGDSAVDLWADHVEPAVSIKNPDKAANSPYNGGLQVMSCIGNPAQVVSGDAKGQWGRVTGKHGGIFHVMVDFKREQMEKMTIGDRVQVRACGQGLALLDFPEIKVRNIDPDLLDVINIKGNKKTGRITIPVTHIIPAAIMGSGLGKSNSFAGDYDIQMFDSGIVEKYRLNDLRFGDIVAISQADHTFGPIYRERSVSIGTIVHSRSTVAGHGPGVTSIFTSTEGMIDTVLDKDSNFKTFFEKLKLPPFD